MHFEVLSRAFGDAARQRCARIERRTGPFKRRVFPVACITGIGRPDVRRMTATSTSDLSAMGNVMNDNKRNIRSERSVPARHRLCAGMRSEEHTSELQSLMRISYAVFCLKKKKKQIIE